ncbi:aa3-type cytochrome c oxidase subunit IV [Allosphingosinicella sp.]|jgi:hypothetical protein
MAAEGEVPEQMLKEHWSGYERFIRLVKWTAIASFIATFLVILVIS